MTTFLRRHGLKVLIALLPLIPLWSVLSGGKVIGPTDQIAQMAPWHGAAAAQPFDVLQADGVLQFGVWRSLVLESWSHGVVPSWNPYELAGTPLLANSQSAAFYPPHILLGLLHIPWPVAITLLAWFHLAVAGLGVFRLAKRLGASDLGAYIGGATFALSPFMLLWTALPSVITTVCWIPWLLAEIVALFEPRANTAKTAACAALFAALMLLSGHLQFGAFGLGAALLALLGFGIRAKRPLTMVWAVLALAVAGFVAAPQLVPVLKFSQFSHRRNTPTEEGYQAYVAGAIKPFELATVTDALALGNPREYRLLQDGRMPSFWPEFALPGRNLAEIAATVGPLVVGLLVLAPWRRRGTIVMGCLAGFALLFALGSELDRFFYFYVPGWSSTGSPGRSIVLFVLGLCVLGALGVRKIEGDPKSQRLMTIGMLLPWLMVGLSVMLASHPTLPQAIDASFFPLISSAAAYDSLPMAAMAAIFASAAIYLPSSKPIQGTAMLVVAPIAIAIAGGATQWVTSGPLVPPPPQTPAPHARIAVINDRWSMISASHALLPPNMAAAYRIHELGGYDSLLHIDTVSLLRDIDGQDPAPPANGNMMFVKSSADMAKLAQAGVTQVWSLDVVAGKPHTNPDGPFYRYALAGPGRVDVDGRPATITDENCGGVTVEATGPGKLTLRDRNMPGWRASVDGNGADIAGSTWLELELQRGPHKVRFEYTPPGMALGFGLFFVGAGALALLFLAGRRTMEGAVSG